MIQSYPELSMIVPVYNVAEFLPQCLESLAMQKHHLVEIILSDDGSTDESGKLCDAFARENADMNIKVLHSPNGGLSAARNRGIEIASGKYIAFVDSDDYLAADFAEKMLDCARSQCADVVVCAYAEVRGNELCKHSIPSAEYTSRQALEKLCANKEIKNFAKNFPLIATFTLTTRLVQHTVHMQLPPLLQNMAL